MGTGAHNRQMRAAAAKTPLNRVLDQSERVQDKVKQAAADLSSVNELLQDEIGGDTGSGKVADALRQNKEVEAEIDEAAHDLVAVSAALDDEIDAHQDLELRLAETNAALTESRAAESRARHDALHDAITGLPNMTLFQDRLENAVALARRHSRRLAVLFVDIDDFKGVNDSCGHDAGDTVLLTVAQRLQASIRDSDTVSRRGGDEFVILILEPHDKRHVVTLADRIGTNVAVECAVAGVSVSVTVSIGIALYPDHGPAPADLLKHADTAMYAAKQHKPHSGRA